MSAFYDLASLVLVPSGYKASKVYAQKPLTTDGQLTFSRASTATRVNSAGLIEAVSSNVPRLDYQGNTCPKLLLEPQRTNLAVNSENWAGTGWIAESASVTTNSVISPSGYQDADTLLGTGSFSRLRQSGFVLADNTVYTVSSFLKAGTAYSVRLTFVGKDGVDTGYRFNLQNGTAESGAKIEDYGNGWYRCSFTANSGSGATTTTVRFASNDAGTTGGWTNGLTIHAWGAQLEQGSYSTSLIPTLGAAVTRGADACSKTGISSLIGQTEGTIFLDFVYDAANTANERFTISDGTSAKRIFIIINTSQLLSFTCTNAGSDQWNIATTLTVGQRYKIAGAYKSNDIVFYVNGVQIGTDTAASIPDCSNLYFANENGSTQEWNNLTNQLLLFKTRLTNAQLAELTTL